MGLGSDMRVLYHMLFTRGRGRSHAERMENFYGGQAKDYDAFRKRLLYGREKLWRSIPVPENGVWVDLGGGTGWNLENIADQIAQLKKIYVVDLSTSLLAVARDRFEQRQWTNAHAIEADATTFTPEEGLADVVTFSYSLTMIPNWFAAIDNALRMLRPGGHIGVVDFYVSRKHPESQMKRHRWFTRFMWPMFFATDNVMLSPDHLPYLRTRFEIVEQTENRAPVPYVPFFRVPYYTFLGRKKSN